MAFSEVLTALADPTRRSIFEALGTNPMTVRELADMQPVSRPAVSQHLKVLQQAKLVNVLPIGNRRVYSIRHEGLEELRDYVDSFWTDVLQAHGVEIAKRVKSRKGKR